MRHRRKVIVAVLLSLTAILGLVQLPLRDYFAEPSGDYDYESRCAALIAAAVAPGGRDLGPQLARLALGRRPLDGTVIRRSSISRGASASARLAAATRCWRVQRRMTGSTCACPT